MSTPPIRAAITTLAVIARLDFPGARQPAHWQ